VKVNFEMRKSYIRAVIDRYMQPSGRTYSGPIYDQPIEYLDDLNLAMKWLIDYSPFPSAMEHNSPCSIGETVEAALGLPPSTRRIDVELGDASVELKSDRIESSTPKSEASSTLQSENGYPFSGTSDSDRYRQFVEKYGYTTASAAEMGKPVRKDYLNRINLYHKVVPEPHYITGLYIEFDLFEDKIWVCHVDDGRLLYYDQTNIDEIKNKYKLQYSIHANEFLEDGQHYFDFVSVDALTTTMTPFTIRTMYEEILNGNQVLEFRAHICDDLYCPAAGANECGPPGHLRCRGTAFRTPKSRIASVWTVEQIAP